MEPKKNHKSGISARKVITWVAGGLAAGAAVCSAGCVALISAAVSGDPPAFVSDAFDTLIYLSWGLGTAFVVVMLGYAAVKGARRLRRRQGRAPAFPARRPA